MWLFGPVSRYDLVRLGRQKRFFLFRSLFALVLLLLLFVLYLGYAQDAARFSSMGAGEFQVRQLQASARGFSIKSVSAQDLMQSRMAQFGEQFFSIYFISQFFMLYLLTPSLTAGAITEEKQRKTMDFLLTSELTRREIVLGKLFPRMLMLLLMILAGLPVLSMVQLFGGIDRELLWAGFLASLILMISLSGMSLCISVFARKVRESLLKSYLVILGYFCGWGVFKLARGFLLLDASANGSALIELDHWWRVYDIGNPLAILQQLREHVAATGNLGNMHWEHLGKFASFHGVFALLFVGIAIWQVRRAYLRQTYEGKRKTKAKVSESPEPQAAGEPAATATPTSWFFRPRRHPSVSDRPMMWKERWCERTLRFGVTGQTIIILSMILLLSPAVVFAAANAINLASGFVPLEFGITVNAYLRFAGLIFGLLLLLAVGVRAAASIGWEKDRQTWESLISTPLRHNSILLAKWWQSIWSVRWLFCLLVLMWGCGIVALGLHWLALPFLVFNTLAAIFLIGSIGIYSSVRFQTTTRSLMMTVAGLILICITPPVLEKLHIENQQKAVWHDVMNVSPLRMLYVTAVCPADNFEGWIDTQEFAQGLGRNFRKFRMHLSDTRLEHDVQMYCIKTACAGLLCLAAGLAFLVNAASELRRQSGRIDAMKPRQIKRFPPELFHRVAAPPRSRKRWG